MFLSISYSRNSLISHPKAKKVPEEIILLSTAFLFSSFSKKLFVTDQSDGKQEFRRTDFGNRLLAAEGCVCSEAISFW
jgi:hypothetical protein